jgi:hypothetical protein
MACRITELVVDSRDPRALAQWWAEVLGYVVLGEEEDDGAVEIGLPGQEAYGPQPTLVFAPVARPTPGKLGWHVDVNATDRDQAAELARLLALGATPTDVGQGDVGWHVLADPEGNVFCLLGRQVDRL